MSEATHDAFLRDNANRIFVVEDTAKDSCFCSLPAVVSRPRIAYFCGGLLVSRQRHAMGMLVLYDSVPNKPLTEGQRESLLELMDQATTVLQRGMFQMLGSPNAALPSVWIDLDDPFWKVYGINEEWKTVTGVGLDILDRFPGLLSVVMPADGGDSSLMREKVIIECTKLKFGNSMPLIISPKFSCGSTLQYPVGLKQVDMDDETDAPPIVSSSPAYATSSSTSCQSSYQSWLFVPPPDVTTTTQPKPKNLWKVEIHARLQSRPCHSCGDLNDQLHWAPRRSTISILHNNSIGRLSRPFGTYSLDGYDSPTEDGSKDLSGSPIGVMRDFHSGNPFGIPLTSLSRRSSLSMVPSRLFSPRISSRMANLFIGEMLGSGAFANVYAGLMGDHPVAIKIIMLPAGSDSTRLSWLGNYEALIAVDIDHDNIVKTLDWCEVDNGAAGKELWIIQELCSEGTLWGSIAACKFRKPGTSERDYRSILHTALDIARGMCYMHSLHYLHGDLSSNNVLLVSTENHRHWVAKVSDFGLSRLASQGSKGCVTETVGTVAFMAPEILMDGLLTQAADVYSFGVILWELWAGKRAWGELSIAQILFAVGCKGEAVKIPKAAPSDYADLMRDCLSLERSKRPSFVEIVPRIDAMLLILRC